jgi:hypothetical protein
MKKYIITEAQLEKLVNKLDEIWPFGDDKLKFSKLPDFKNPNPDPNKSDDDNNKEYAESIKPLSFQEFITQSEKDSQADPNVGPTDVKANVAANVSANRASANIDKAEDHLLDIVSKHYKGISSYSLIYDKSVLGDGEDLAAIIITIAYFVDKKKYSDVKLRYDKNLIFLNNKNLRGLLSDDFTKTQTKIDRNPNDPDDIKIHTDNNTIVIHTNKQKVTTKVEFNNIMTSTIDQIITYFKDRKNLDFVNKALPKKIRDIKRAFSPKTGNQIIVTY